MLTELEIPSQLLLTLKACEFNVPLATTQVDLQFLTNMCETALKSRLLFYLRENPQYLHYKHICVFAGSQVRFIIIIQVGGFFCNNTFFSSELETLLS